LQAGAYEKNYFVVNIYITAYDILVMCMYDNEIRLKLQVGVLRDLYKRELMNKRQLDECIKKITQIEEGEKSHDTKESSSLL